MSQEQVFAFEVPPVVKQVQLRCAPATAFERFTRDIHLWWPVRTHSLGQEEVIYVGFEPHVGGRLFERTAQGEEATWGTVTHWDPPTGLAFTWHVGRDADTAQRVELSFVGNDAGTSVRLVHSGWERLGPDGARGRAEYDGGWNRVFLQCYRDHADAAPSMLPTRCVVVHLPGPRWRPGVPSFEQPGLQAHVDHYRKLFAEGKLLLGGPFLDDQGGGMMVAKPGVDKDELTAFAAEDPAVRSGLIAFVVRPWLVGMDAAAGGR